MQTLTVNGFQNSRIYQRWFVELHTYYLQISGSDQFLFYRPVIDFKVAKPNEHTHAHTHTATGCSFYSPHGWKIQLIDDCRKKVKQKVLRREIWIIFDFCSSGFYLNIIQAACSVRLAVLSSSIPLVGTKRCNKSLSGETCARIDVREWWVSSLILTAVLVCKPIGVSWLMRALILLKSTYK